MAITFIAAISGGIKQDSATVSMQTPAATALVDDVLVATMALDNSGTSGASAYSSIDQPFTGAVTWQTAQVVNRTAGSAANDGTTLVVIPGVVTSQVSSQSSLSANVSPNVLAKAYTVYLFRGASSTIQGFASSTGTGTGPTVTSGSTPLRAVINGDVVLGVVAVESATAVTTEDTDTLNGSWSSNQAGTSSGTGGDATKMSIGAQYKIVTADGNQTYNPAVTNTDWATAILTLGVPAVPASFIIPHRHRGLIIR